MKLRPLPHFVLFAIGVALVLMPTLTAIFWPLVAPLYCAVTGWEIANPQNVNWFLTFPLILMGTGAAVILLVLLIQEVEIDRSERPRKRKLEDRIEEAIMMRTAGRVNIPGEEIRRIIREELERIYDR